MSAAEPIRQSTLVRASSERVFDGFVATIGRWWPVRPYSLGQDAVVDVTVTPALGGLVYETRGDGSTAVWGRVLVWEPPVRLAMTWEVFAGGTEVELVFTALGPALTRVELEHRGWERMAEPEIRSATAAPGGYVEGWRRILAALTEAVEGEPGSTRRPSAARRVEVNHPNSERLRT